MEPISQIATFCDELRKAREFQGLSLNDIAKRTRISIEYLSSLEEGRLSGIPAPIRRGVISAYAQTSGMNAEKVLKTLEDLQGAKPVAEIGSLTSRQHGSERMTVGMTRAQIRTAWFASIAGNSFLHWSLTVLVLLVGMVLAAQWRGIVSPTAIMPPQSASVSDPVSSFRSDYQFEIWEVLPDSNKPSTLRTDYRTTLVSFDTCDVSVLWGIDTGPSLKLYPHDKTILMHNTGIRIGVGRDFSGHLVSGQDTFHARFSKDSLASWLCFPDLIGEIKADSSAKADSVKG